MRVKYLIRDRDDKYLACRTWSSPTPASTLWQGRPARRGSWRHQEVEVGGDARRALGHDAVAGCIKPDASIDSTTRPAHHHAADSHRQKEPPAGIHEEPADHAL